MQTIVQGLGCGPGPVQLPHNLQGSGATLRQDVGCGPQLGVRLQGNRQK